MYQCPWIRFNIEETMSILSTKYKLSMCLKIQAVKEGWNLQGYISCGIYSIVMPLPSIFLDANYIHYPSLNFYEKNPMFPCPMTCAPIHASKGWPLYEIGGSSLSVVDVHFAPIIESENEIKEG